MKAIAFLILALTAPSLRAETGFLIDPSEEHQTIDHFGANDAWSFENIGAWSDASKNKLADLLYDTGKGIGLSFCRFYAGAGVNRKTIRDPWRTAESFEIAEGVYDWNRLAASRWFLRAAKARGVTRFGMTFYSPPPRLTRNGLTNHGDDKTSTTNLKPGAESSYARYIADILAHFQHHPDPAERVLFGRVFPVNEPQWDWFSGQEGCRASNADILRLFAAIDREFTRRRLPTLIAGPESGSVPAMYGPERGASAKWRTPYGDYLATLSADAAVARRMGGVMTYHSYWSDAVPAQLVPHREALARALAAKPRWRLWQSEYCLMEGRRDTGMDAALRVATVIHCDLAIANASAWQWWLAVSKGNYKDGLLYTDWRKPGDPENLIETKTFRALGNFSLHIRPGMKRIGLRGPQDIRGLMASAYINRADRKIVVVAINAGAREAVASFRLAARGGQAAAGPLVMTPWLTSAASDLRPGPPLDAACGLAIPPRSVMTLVYQRQPTRDP